jgi:MbtH protein
VEEEVLVNDDDLEYEVMVNNEDQYCLWPILKAVPSGWQQIGPIGSKQDCLAYIEQHYRWRSPRAGLTLVWYISPNEAPNKTHTPIAACWTRTACPAP